MQNPIARPVWLAAALVLVRLTFTAVAQTATLDVHAVALAAQPLPLSAVRLTGGPLQHAQELDAKYLLELQPDRMLYYLRLRRTDQQDRWRLWRMGWRGSPTHRPHRRALSFRCQLYVCRHRRSAIQGAR